jgi:hypothetical protein
VCQTSGDHETRYWQLHWSCLRTTGCRLWLESWSMISVADACATCECIGQTSPKFDFRIQPAAEVLSVCERKHNLVLALPTYISIHMDRYPVRYSNTFRVAWFCRSLGFSQRHAIPVVAKNAPIPCSQASKHLMCDGGQNVSRFRLMLPFAKSRKAFHNSRSASCDAFHRVPCVVDQGSGGPLRL